MARGKSDPADSMDPRDQGYKKVLRETNNPDLKRQSNTQVYIPKNNLGTIARERFGSYAACSRELGLQKVEDYVSGKRRLSNANLLKAAEVLNVSPLFLLDLTNEENSQPDADAIKRIMDDRKEIHEFIYEFLPASSSERDEGRFLKWTGGISNTPKYRFDCGPCHSILKATSDPWVVLEAFWELLHASGDYRDLNRLANDMLKAYPMTPAAMLSLPPIGS